MTLARTALGTLRGVRSPGLRTFKGVRYAAPARRFAAPSPAVPWEGIADAVTPGAPAPQRPGRMSWVPGLGLDPAAGREDCLYLNIWTPSCEERLPVLVFVHGGAFVSGSGAQRMYDGGAPARDHGLVVVTANYRPGLFGLWYGDGVPANLALRDHIAALEWVRDHISALGADPAEATAADLLSAEDTTGRTVPPVGGLLPFAPVADGTSVVGVGRLGAGATSAAGVDAPAARGSFRRHAEEIVRAHRGPARHLVCAHRSPMSHGGIALGACHLVDVPLYFGTHGSRLTGSGPEVTELAHSMTKEFARFCRGDRTPE
ncbi:carboxylesterase family protein [Nonomuraea lactucae]|uniref:carboxylesterase family protein n=1 Tax=Nonomuraea lactucae TaxID=2249762 RepID=UPI000DE463C7|nr:carboxylesterase family protein [Nonomuraea lactucae]